MSTRRALARIDKRKVAALLRRWRSEADMTLLDAMREIEPLALSLGFSVSIETVRRYEAGDFDPKRINLWYLICVARAYGHDVADYGPDVAEAAKVAAQALGELTGPFGQEKVGNRCIGSSWLIGTKLAS